MSIVDHELLTSKLVVIWIGLIMLRVVVMTPMTSFQSAMVEIMIGSNMSWSCARAVQCERTVLTIPLRTRFHGEFGVVRCSRFVKENLTTQYSKQSSNVDTSEKETHLNTVTASYADMQHHSDGTKNKSMQVS